MLVGALTSLVFQEAPDLAEERRTAGAKAKPWDRVLVPLLMAVLPLVW